MRTRTRVLTAMVVLTGAASGQQVIAARAGLVSRVEGAVELDGMAVVLHLDENSSLRMVANRLTDARLELVSGSAMVQADGVYQKSGIALMLRETPVWLSKTGLYRFDAEPPEIRVFAGSATVQRSGAPVAIAAGWELPLAGAAAEPARFDRKKLDALELWSKRRVAELAKISGQSSQAMRDSRDLSEAATQAATVDAEVHSPEYRRTSASQQPAPSEFPGIRGYLQDRARICAASR